MDSTPTSGACRKILFWALLVVGGDSGEGEH
jgi:hypothetical protein